MRRRLFLQTLLAAGAAGTARATPARPAARGRRTRLGIDNFAVRAMRWKAPRLVDYAASLRLDSLFITDLDAFESLEDRPLRELRKRAADKGVQIQLGTWSICPTSKTFKDTWGTAEEHLGLAIRAARALGSPVVRVILGNAEDRRSEGGIRARMADTVKVLRACRGRALEAGVKIAMENHAGDMRSHEVVALVEEAGTDFVGINFDSGNALWTLEDPLAALEVMGRYVVTTSLRDGVVWPSEHGATVQWTAMGEGVVDFPRFFERFAALCPGVPVHIETISGFNRELPFYKAEFWDAHADARAADFARFLALARKGQPRAPWKVPEGQEREPAEQAFQRGEVERSIKYCREVLGLGLRA